MIIAQGKNIPLNENTGTLPDMSGALLNWFRPMVFISIVTTILNGRTVNVPTSINFQGVWQPMGPQALSQKPSGETAWKWFTVHAQISLRLTPDEVITYLGTQYRVKDKIDYTEYGYVEYHLCQDYAGSGPVYP